MIQNAAYRILTCFTTSQERNFAEVCKEAGYPSDLGGYYLRQLVRRGYLERGGERGRYTITPKGRSQWATGSEKQVFVVRPRLIAMVVAQKGENYLVQRRAQQPFIGAAEWLASAVALGEPMPDTTRRLVERNFDNTLNPVLAGFFRRTDMYNGEVFDDKVFVVHTLSLADTAEVKLSSNVGDIEFQPIGTMADIASPSRSLLDILEFVKQTSVSYVEHTYQLVQTDFNPTVTN